MMGPFKWLTNFTNNIQSLQHLVLRLARAVTWTMPAPVARGHHELLNTATCPIRGLYNPAMMTMFERAVV